MRFFLLTPLLLLTALTVSVPVFAQEEAPATSPEVAAPAASFSRIDLGLEELASVLRLSDEDPRIIAVRLINVALGFLAIVTLVMVLYGGFQFLVSGGKEENTARAGATIRSAIIGLLIILASWAGVRYVLEQFVAATAGS